MASLDYLPDSEITKAMLRGLDDHLREKIKARILAIVQPDIDAAVDEAMQAFKGTVEKQRDFECMQTVVRVILEDRREHKNR